MRRLRHNAWRDRISMRPSMGLVPSIAIIVVVTTGFALLARRGFEAGDERGMIGVLLAAPVAAVLIAPALIALFPAYVEWVEHRVWGRWQGRYYAFDDRQVRIVEARGTLWFRSADVHAALGMTVRPAVLAPFVATERRRDERIGDALSNAGLVRLLARSTDPRTRRFLVWAERDVRRPWRKRREAGVDEPVL